MISIEFCINAVDPDVKKSAVKDAEQAILELDRALLLGKATKYCYLRLVAERVGWKQLWDYALDYDPETL